MESSLPSILNQFASIAFKLHRRRRVVASSASRPHQYCNTIWPWWAKVTAAGRQLQIASPNYFKSIRLSATAVPALHSLPCRRRRPILTRPLRKQRQSRIVVPIIVARSVPHSIGRRLAFATSAACTSNGCTSLEDASGLTGSAPPQGRSGSAHTPIARIYLSAAAAALLPPDTPFVLC